MVMATIDKDAISVRNSLESPLLRLPGEIRDKIYAYALGGHVVKVYKRSDNEIQSSDDETRCEFAFVSYASADGSSRGGTRFQQASALNLVCRQTANEAKGQLLSSNIFVLDSYTAALRMNQALTQEQLDKITNIVMAPK